MKKFLKLLIMSRKCKHCRERVVLVDFFLIKQVISYRFTYHKSSNCITNQNKGRRIEERKSCCVLA